MLDALSVVRAALRLLFRHWPMLLAIVFAGLAVRQGIFWVSVQASALNGVLGYLVFALVPLVMLMTFIFLLLTVRPSLPAVSKSKVVNKFGSALVPFMAIYVAFDYFVEDDRVYRWYILTDEVFANAEVFDPNGKTNVVERLPKEINAEFLWVVGTAVALRFALSFWKRSSEIPWLAYVRAYLEVLWAGLVLNRLVRAFSEDWYANRRFIRWFSDMWEEFVDFVGPLKNVAAFLGEAFTSIDTTLVVPILWLAIGVIVFGRRHDEAGLAAQVSAQQQQGQPAVQQKGPKAIRWVLTDAKQEFAPLTNSLQVIRAAGLRAMLLFCLAFLIANSSRHWLWQLERVIIGPQDVDTVWLPLLDPLTEFNKAISIVLIICLVAAAADKVLAVLPPPAPEASDSANGQANEPGQQVGLHDPQGSGFSGGRSDEVYGGLVRS